MPKRIRNIRTKAFTGGESSPKRSKASTAGASVNMGPKQVRGPEMGMSLGGFAGEAAPLPPPPDFLTPLFGMAMSEDRTIPSASSVLAILRECPSLTRLAGPDGGMTMDHTPAPRIRMGQAERMRF